MNIRTFLAIGTLQHHTLHGALSICSHTCYTRSDSVHIHDHMQSSHLAGTHTHTHTHTHIYYHTESIKVEAHMVFPVGIIIITEVA